VLPAGARVILQGGEGVTHGHEPGHTKSPDGGWDGIFVIYWYRRHAVTIEGPATAGDVLRALMEQVGQTMRLSAHCPACLPPLLSHASGASCQACSLLQVAREHARNAILLQLFKYTQRRVSFEGPRGTSLGAFMGQRHDLPAAAPYKLGRPSQPDPVRLPASQQRLTIALKVSNAH
jgi:hypothetical protein